MEDHSEDGIGRVMQIETPSYEVHIWRATVLVLGAVLLATEVLERPGFWSSYARDLTGPALMYLLFRGRHRASKVGTIPGVRTPNQVAAFVLGFCVTVEAAQYFGLYGHFDPYDFVAYVTGLVPFYLVDRWRWRASGTDFPSAA